MSEPVKKRSRKGTFITLGVMFVAVAGMGTLTATAPELYTLFCSVTGAGGTTQRLAGDAQAVSDQTIEIRFDSNISPNLGWKFVPDQRSMTIKIGEQAMATFSATSLTNKVTTGTASYNVTPFKAGPYFDKIQCFCFTEQTLKPGQTTSMPVTFFVDPDILKDPSTKDLKTITLSYTFFPAMEEDKKTGPSAAADGKQGG